MQRFGYVLCVVLSLAGIPFAALADDKGGAIGESVKALPLFDAHVHYNEDAWGPYPPATVLELMDASGVAMALVSSTPDQGTIKLFDFAPSRIVPELRPYHGGAGQTDWTQFPGMFDYLMKRLEAYPHQGIGEFHLHQVDPKDEALLRRIAQIAKSKNKPLHVHSGKDPVDFLFSLEPALNIIWAHAGMSGPPEIIEAMMARYKTLYADTSYRENDILTDDDKIDPAWRRVLERFPDRFMVGTDTWENDQWNDYAGLVKLNRQWLSRFPRHIAEKIAYQNGERLFGRKAGRHLLGKR